MLDFAEGAVLVLYTDGLVERRHESIDDRLDLLRRSVAGGVGRADRRRRHGPSDRQQPVDDDTALLVVART